MIECRATIRGSTAAEQDVMKIRRRGEKNEWNWTWMNCGEKAGISSTGAKFPLNFPRRCASYTSSRSVGWSRSRYLSFRSAFHDSFRGSMTTWHHRRQVGLRRTAQIGQSISSQLCRSSTFFASSGPETYIQLKKSWNFCWCPIMRRPTRVCVRRLCFV